MAIGVRRIKHWMRLATDIHYREFDRLLTLPRKQAGITRLLGPEMFFVDGRSCALQYRHIFEHRCYALQLDSTAPYMLDAGANIGMATLYFKQLFPSAKIDAFEADPGIVEVLRKNVTSFHLRDVKVHHAAVSDKVGDLQFVSTGLDNGYVSRVPNEQTVTVPSVRLRDWLQEPVDFLKLDVEGTECDIIADLRPQLKNVSRIFVDYHSMVAQRQRLPEMLTCLQEAGFRIFIQTDFCPSSPLLDPVSDGPMDMRLDIFGTRPD